MNIRIVIIFAIGFFLSSFKIISAKDLATCLDKCLIEFEACKQIAINEGSGSIATSCNASWRGCKIGCRAKYGGKVEVEKNEKQNLELHN